MLILGEWHWNQIKADKHSCMNIGHSQLIKIFTTQDYHVNRREKQTAEVVESVGRMVVRPLTESAHLFLALEKVLLI